MVEQNAAQAGAVESRKRTTRTAGRLYLPSGENANSTLPAWPPANP